MCNLGSRKKLPCCETIYVFSGHIVEEEVEFSLSELSQACGVNGEWLNKNRHQWRFSGPCIQRVRIGQRLQQDLGVNLSGVALTLELLGEISDLNAGAADINFTMERN